MSSCFQIFAFPNSITIYVPRLPLNGLVLTQMGVQAAASFILVLVSEVVCNRSPLSVYPKYQKRTKLYVAIMLPKPTK